MWRLLLLLLLVLFAACSKLIDLNDVTYEGADAAVPGGAPDAPPACQNTSGDVRCYVPATCADVKAHVPGATDGAYMLYLAGDASKPWTAYCAQMATTPREYLSLSGVNVSIYAAGGASLGTDVETTYAKVHFDPATSKIDISDRTFATSQGMLDHSSTKVTVTSMPFGVAMDCRDANSEAGRALIDLTGTAFALTGSTEFADGGAEPGSSIQLTNGNQSATIHGGGYCGWMAPAGAPQNPFNDNVTDGELLDVVYQPSPSLATSRDSTRW